MEHGQEELIDRHPQHNTQHSGWVFFILAGSMITLFLWAMMSVYSVGIVIVALGMIMLYSPIFR